jgi:hydrogenase expression/formation protein HypC
MCLGLPMRVVESDGYFAIVEGRGERRRVSLLIVGEVAIGTPVLVHADNAVRVLSEEELPLLEQALDGLEAAVTGGPVEAYFADLVGREPELPPHLRQGGS